MFARTIIGVAWSAVNLRVVLLRLTRSSLTQEAIFTVRIPSGVIAEETGQVLDRCALREVVQQVPIFRSDLRTCYQVFMAVPSSAAFVQTWVEPGRPRSYSRQDLTTKLHLSFASRIDEITVDIHQRWLASNEHTRVMTLVARKELIHEYVEALGAHQTTLMQTTTAEIARYNLWCALHPETIVPSLVFISVWEEVAEITVWENGIICHSECLFSPHKTVGTRAFNDTQEAGRQEPLASGGMSATNTVREEVLAALRRLNSTYSETSLVVLGGSPVHALSLAGVLASSHSRVACIHRHDLVVGRGSKERDAALDSRYRSFQEMSNYCDAFGAASAGVGVRDAVRKWREHSGQTRGRFLSRLSTDESSGRRSFDD